MVETKTTRRPRRRSPGRPPAQEGAALREALIDAALREFARLGIRSATLAGIARAAGATPALIHYHFGSKFDLVQAVVDERLRVPVDGLLALLQSEADPLERLRRFALAYTQTVAAHPWIPRLVVREVLAEDGLLRKQFAHRFAANVATRVREAVAAVQASGGLRDDLPPEALTLALVSLLVFPFVAAPVVGPALGIQVTPEMAQSLAQRHWDIFCRGAEAKP